MEASTNGCAVSGSNTRCRRGTGRISKRSVSMSRVLFVRGKKDTELISGKRERSKIIHEKEKLSEIQDSIVSAVPFGNGCDFATVEELYKTDGTVAGCKGRM